ncbi:putative E3 ubiquitin-protein ligase XERICO [Sesamum alatum]|uniref:E3 ubiquitin-protein ligase XERICO n=1 Tax=Sesamum alatum TaxID=300844 RepID=A0AAE1YGM0_9LAMI|nr:putative E3 ubiquitin-protein ligase XERICO [Sesamum alatum]
MGLSNFPSPAEGVIPLLVMNTVMSVALVKNKLRSVLQVVGAASGDGGDQEFEDEYAGDGDGGSRPRRVSITRYGSLCRNRYCRCSTRGSGGCTGAGSSGVGGSGGGGGDEWPPAVECCVCLCRFEAEEEVSELSCKHFFHKGCLDKWFDNQHITCPLCRSIM